MVSRALAAASVPALCLARPTTRSRAAARSNSGWRWPRSWRFISSLTLLGTVAISGLGATLAIAAASERDQLADGLNGQLAQSQGDEMLAFVLSRLRRSRFTSVVRSRRDVRARPTAQVTRRQATVGAIVAVLIAIAVGLPGRTSASGRSSRTQRPACRHRPHSASRAPAAAVVASTGKLRRRERSRARPGSALGRSSSGSRATAPFPVSFATLIRCTSSRWPRWESSASL